MDGFFSLFSSSAKELKSVRCITVTGIFIALSMILESFTINLPYFKINFAFLALAIIGMLFGPVVAMLAGGICDILGYIVSPQGAFIPVYILIAMLQGMIYGIVLYRKDIKKLLIFMVTSRLLDIIIINLFLNTYFNMYYGFIPQAAFSEAIAARTVKNLIQFAVDIPLMYAVLPAAYIAYNRIIAKKKTTA